MNLKDLEKKVDDDIRAKNNAFYVGRDGKGGGDSERWGIRCLDLTNEFRKEQGQSPMLSWN